MHDWLDEDMLVLSITKPAKFALWIVLNGLKSEIVILDGLLANFVTNVRT